MEKDNVKLITISTYSTIFTNGISPKHEIISYIESIDRREWLIAISYLLNNMEFERINRVKFSISKPYRNDVRKLIAENVLYSKQGLLFLAKWIVEYGVEFDSSFNKNIDNIIVDNVISVQLMLSDYLPSDNIYSAISYLFKNYAMNSKRNIKNDLARSYRIFTELSRKEDLYIQNDYMNFYEEYYKKYDHTINEYISYLFPAVQMHLDYNRVPIINIDLFSKDIKDQNKFLLLINSITSKIDDLKEWSNRTIKNTWDFSVFMTKPFIDIGDGFILSLHEDFVINQLFESLFYRIRDSYPKENKKIIDFLGRPFEKYVEELTSNAVNETTIIKYEFIPEFKFGSMNKDSSDSYILFGSKLLIIEAKSKRPIVSTYYKDDDEELEKQIKKIAVKPINQAIKAYLEIKNNKEGIIFKDVTDIYIVSVSLLSVPRISEIQNYIENQIISDLGEELKGYFSISIEEFEYLCGLTKEGIDIFDIIKEFLNRKGLSPLINFLNDKGYFNQNLEWLSNNYLKFGLEANQILFN